MTTTGDSVVVTGIRREGTGDGALPLPEKTTGRTPDHLPNVIIQTITPLASILIRAARAYVTTLISLMGASMVGLGGDALVPHDFFHRLRDYAAIALAAAAWAAIQNTGELLAKIDQKMPSFRG